jgi:Mor family transcriptional regulator
MLIEDAEWIKDVKLEALPPIYRQAAEVLGSVEAAIKLHSIFGGLQVYFHKLDDLLRQQRDQLIRKEYQELQGKMPVAKIYPHLALKYDLTSMWVRQIVDHRDDNGQQNLFD